MIGVPMSLIWGTRAAMIHTVSRYNRWRWFWNGFYEFMQNFVGSFAGWCCVGALAVRISEAPRLCSLGIVDAFLFVTAIIGTSGRLAETIHKLLDAIGNIALGVAKKLAG